MTDAAVPWQQLAPRVLAAVTKRCGDFAAAEDAVQEALCAAASNWPTHGVPHNPAGWLYTVALRRLADHADADVARRRREQDIAAAALASEAQRGDEQLDSLDGPDEAGDDTLALLFTCCHPALPVASAIALMLRAVAGLSTEAIARAFLVSTATMAQRIARAKQTIAGSGVPLALPPPLERTRRLDAVLHVIYLLANEGHFGGDGDEPERRACANEAIRLARLVLRAAPEHAEAAGLLALLLLTESRRDARTGADDELIPLDEQDRRRWHRGLIAEGVALIEATIARGRVGPFQLQAAIAAVHAEAATFEATDWPQILALYTLLLRMTDSPVVALNRAVAVAMVNGVHAGLALLDELAKDPRLAAGHRLEAVRAHLLHRAGDAAAARLAFTAAAARAIDPIERAYLQRRAQR